MTRSEMVMKGIFRLTKIDSNPIPQTNIRPEDYHFVVNTLLDCFEKNGMLPPDNNMGFIEDKNMYTWEPEDE